MNAKTCSSKTGLEGLLDNTQQELQKTYSQYLAKRDELVKRLENENQAKILIEYAKDLNIEALSYNSLESEFKKINLFAESNFSKECRNKEPDARLNKMLKNNYASSKEINNNLLNLNAVALESSFSCKECSSTKFDKSSGFFTCLNCGLVDEEVIDESEVKAYTKEEINSRKRTEKVRGLGARTLIVGDSDYKGIKLSPEKTLLFSSLKKINTRLISSIERNYWVAKPILLKIADKMPVPIPYEVTETAWRIYQEVARQSLTRGRSINNFCAASLYAAIRMYELPINLDEVISDATEKTPLHRSLSLVVTKVLPKLNYQYKKINPLRLICRYSNELNTSMQVQAEAVKLFREFSEKTSCAIGKDPKGYAAAVIYIAAKNNRQKETQAKLSETVKITQVTLRQRAKEILAFTNK